jgi:hypothetical protein
VRPCPEGVAKNLVDKLYGPDGPFWGTKLTEVEQLLLDLRQVLTERVLAEARAPRAGRPAHRARALRRAGRGGGRLPGAAAAQSSAGGGDTAPDAQAEAAAAGRRWQPPQVQEKRLVASRQSGEAFGPLVARAAGAMGL